MPQAGQPSHPRRSIAWLACALFLASTAWQATQAAAPPLRLSFDLEEFNGPLPGWANIRDYGAVGDGVADDTAAFQAALNDLARITVLGDANWHPEFYNSGSPATLYLPAGTYKVSQTLLIAHRTSANLVGESPTTTRILWAGPAGGTMLITDGNLLGRFHRLTWDGAGTAGIGVAHWWNRYKSALGDYYGGSSQHIDEVFTDMKIGIAAGCCAAGTSGAATAQTHPGTRLDGNSDLRLNHKADYVASQNNYWAFEDYGDLDSEGSVVRTRFIRNSVAGVHVESWNALNWWVLDSRFEDCAIGVTNAPGAGNFMAYRNTFLRSTDTDIRIANTGWFSLHDNVSVQSKQFYHADEIGRNGAAVIVQNNRILNPTGTNPVYTGNLGPLILLDNQMKSPAGATGPVVVQQDWEPGRDIFSVGNAFTVPASQQIKMRYDTYNPALTAPNRLRTLGDTQVSASAISDAVPAPIDAPPLTARNVFVVPVRNNHFVFWGSDINQPVSTGQDIQNTIDAALASGTDNPVVYLPSASYALSAPIRIPKLRRIQLVGDGRHASLYAANANITGALIELEGPSLATLKDFALGSSTNDAIHLSDADQDGGHVFITGFFGGALKTRGLLRTRVSALANTGFSSISATNTASLVSAGQNLGLIQSQDHSRMVMMDSWKEASGIDVAQAQSGTVSILGAHFTPQLPNHVDTNSQLPSVTLDDFSGHFAMVGVQYGMTNSASSNGIAIGAERAAQAGEPGTNVLLLGISSNTPNYYNRASAGGRVGFAMMKQGDATTPSPADVGQTDDTSVLDGLAQIRSVSWDRSPYQAPAGATDVRIYRIFAPNARDGVVIDGNTSDCLDPDGNILAQGALRSVTLARSAGTRTATAAECPYGGTVPTVTVRQQAMVCNTTKIVASGDAVDVLADAGTPTCNAPIACTDASGALHPDGSAFSSTSAPLVSTRAATAQECPAAGGTVQISTTQTQAQVCTQGVISAVGAPAAQSTQTIKCNPPTATPPDVPDADAPLPDWAVGLLGLQLAGMAVMRQRRRA